MSSCICIVYFSILQNQFGLVRYEIIGDDQAAQFFAINEENGEISLLQSVEDDTQSTYQVIYLFICLFIQVLFSYLFASDGSTGELSIALKRVRV